MERKLDRNYFQEASRLMKMELLIQNLSWVIFVIAIIIHRIMFSCIIALLLTLLICLVKWFRKNCQSLAEENRREFFWENSFKIRTSSYQNDSYYNNDVRDGLYKAFVNVFESSLFSTVIASKMLKKNRVKSVVMVMVYTIILAIAIAKDEYFIAVAGILFIFFVVLDWLMLMRYTLKMQKIHFKIREMFDNGLSRGKFGEKDKQCDVLILITEYEVNIARNCILLNSVIFEQINDSLSLEWEELKKNYGIIQ